MILDWSFYFFNSGKPSLQWKFTRYNYVFIKNFPKHGRIKTGKNTITCVKIMGKNIQTTANTRAWHEYL